MKLEDFRLESYDERALILNALMYYAAYRSDDIDLFKHGFALANLRERLAKTQCQPGGCSVCGDGDDYD